MRLIRLYLVAVACVPGVLSSGCGSGDDQDTTITYWRTLTGAAGQAQDELVYRFNAEHQVLRVHAEFQGSYSDLRTKLLTAAATGSGPEVSQLGTYEIREMANAGLLVDLRSFVTGPNGIDTSDWAGSLSTAGEIDGGLYWLPFNVSVPIVYYNADALRAAGFDAPPETWTEFFDCARRLTQRDDGGRVKRVGLALWDDAWPLLSAIWSEGGELCSKDYTSITLNDPAAVSVLTEFQRLIQEGSAVLGVAANGGHRAMFKQGAAAMILDSPAPFEEIFSQASGFAPAVSMFPAGKVGRVFAPGGGGLVMLGSTPEAKRAAAWEFIRFALSPEELAKYARRSGYVAYSTRARDHLGNLMDDPNYAEVYAGLPYVRGDFSFNMSPAVREPFTRAYQRIFVEHADGKAALDEADAEAEKRIADERRTPGRVP